MSDKATKRKADRAEARARGEPVETEKPTALDPAIAHASGETTESETHHASGRPKVRYGPPPSYPDTEEGEQELFDALLANAFQGYSLHATSKRIGIAPSTLRGWCEKPFGGKLRDCLKFCDEMRRGALEEKAIDGLNNKDFNGNLFKFMMGNMYPDAYRPAALPPGDPGAPSGDNGGITEFEFKRRIASYLDRKVAEERGEIVTLVGPPKEKDMSE